MHDYQKLMFFLKQKKILDSYKLNCRSWYSKSSIYDFTKSVNNGSFISLAFSWNDSKEGRDFWKKVSSEWRVFKDKPKISIRFRIK